jgi:hypothetical protein
MPPHLAMLAVSTMSLLCVLTMWSPVSAYGQTASANSDTLPNDFLTLADLRGANSVEITTLERQIQRLQDSLPEAETRARFAGDFIERRRKDSLALAKKDQRTPQEEQRLGDINLGIRSAALDQQGPKRMRDSLDAKGPQLAAKKRLAAQIQAKIASILNPEQEFKRTMSKTFALLIGCVIVGFFILAGIDPALREKVFGGQAGMQFLTLFSLVIAIILFGITGVLEGKELSALLGGLSGYILGRTNTPLDSSGKTP